MSRYSPTAKDHFNHPRHVGRLPHPDGEGIEGQPGGGNYMIITVNLAHGQISQIAFQTYGCPGAICCGSALAEMAAGRPIDEARAITPDHLLHYLERIPLGKHHCAGLAVGALRKALEAAEA